MKYWGISTIACLLLALGCSTTQPTATARSIVITDDSATNMFKDLLSVIQGTHTQPAIQPGLNEIPIEAFKPVGDLQQAATFSNYTVRIYRENDSGLGCFEVLCDQKRIYAQSGVKFQVGGTFDGNNQERPLPMGADITGAGQPNLVVLEWTGGAHCCYKYHVFEIGKAFRPVASISAADGIAKFEDLDHDGLQEVILGDFTFAYRSLLTKKSYKYASDYWSVQSQKTVKS